MKTDKQKGTKKPPLDLSGLLADLPENKPLYKNSGLWQLRSDDMAKTLLWQDIHESDLSFFKRCTEVS
ncbi:MAG: hypothetical protein ACUZ8H_13165 [Candidatus Anammoxibacter sp.]